MRYYLDKLFYNTDVCARTYCGSQSAVCVLDLGSRKIVQSAALQIVPFGLASGSFLPRPYLLPGNQSLGAHEDQAALPQFWWFIFL